MLKKTKMRLKLMLNFVYCIVSINHAQKYKLKEEKNKATDFIKIVSPKILLLIFNFIKVYNVQLF